MLGQGGNRPEKHCAHGPGAAKTPFTYCRVTTKWCGNAFRICFQRRLGPNHASRSRNTLRETPLAGYETMTLANTPQHPAGGYSPAAVYFSDSDCVEYVKEDNFVVYHRVDNFLTIIFDETKIIPVGFKLKGFKHVFNMHLKSLFELNDKQFLLLATAIEAVCTELGDALFADDER